MALIVDNVSFFYKKNSWILKDVSLSIKPGEVVGLSGYSGCGKTTLARLMAGYIKPEKGKIFVDNKIMDKKILRPVQLIYQHPEKAINPKWHMEKVLKESYIPSDEILETFGIRKEWMKRWPIELSGGELQRFCIVRALNPNTKYIIADEMTTMLDAITQAEIWNEFLRICKNRNIGVIVVSHESALLNRICDKVFDIKGNII